ncbi:hypothetical protein [Kitasatospora sp. NPDC088134]|uniref:hypothetical protein n=1 Tax=Kitasatospora sp. NPDC088134 TaxID=3364071 RepID=UPI0038047677
MKFMVQTLAAAGELQRDLQRELTYDGLRAAEAKGDKGGRRPAVTAAKTDDVRTAYVEGRSIAALARDHGVSRGAIRTAVAGLLPEHVSAAEEGPAPELPVTLDMPGQVAEFLRSAELDPVERAALDQGVTVRRGQGFTLRVTAVPSLHRQFLARCRPLDGSHGLPAVPAQRKARREDENRVSTLTPRGRPRAAPGRPQLRRPGRARPAPAHRLRRRPALLRTPRPGVRALNARTARQAVRCAYTTVLES